MTDKSERTAERTKVIIDQTFGYRSLIPFTSGLILFVYAFFWPGGYGRWLGTIVQAFRSAAGF